MIKFNNDYVDICGDDATITRNKCGEIYSYKLAIEGFIGFDNIRDGIDFYSIILNHLREILKKENIDLTKNNEMKVLYSSCSIEIVSTGVKNENGTEIIFIFSDCPEKESIEECYFWLEDVIKQLKKVKLKFN